MKRLGSNYCHSSAALEGLKHIGPANELIMKWVDVKGWVREGGIAPSCPAKGYGGGLFAPPTGSGAPPQKLCQLCIINVLNHYEFH